MCPETQPVQVEDSGGLLHREEDDAAKEGAQDRAKGRTPDDHVVVERKGFSLEKEEKKKKNIMMMITAMPALAQRGCRSRCPSRVCGGIGVGDIVVIRRSGSGSGGAPLWA